MKVFLVRLHHDRIGVFSLISLIRSLTSEFQRRWPMDGLRFDDLLGGLFTLLGTSAA
jgi:hypothetical protein